MARPYSGPQFFFQVGHQDHTIALELLEKGAGQGAILSPRHLPVDRLQIIAQQVLSAGKQVLVDPQLYNPAFIHSDGYPALGPQTAQEAARFVTNPESLRRIVDFQLGLGVTSIILPSAFAETNGASAARYVRESAAVIRQYLWERGFRGDLLATVPVTYRVIESNTERERVLDILTGMEADGVYLVHDVPEDTLFPTSTGMLRGQLDFVFRLKQNRFKVFLGYTSFGAVMSFPFGLDGYSSGGFQNRRRFVLSEWSQEESDDEEETTQRPPLPRYASLNLMGTMVYPDDADLLHATGLWMGIDRSPYAEILFDGQVPSSKRAVWKRRFSFQHYLEKCNELAVRYQALTLEQRVAQVQQDLSEAQDRHRSFSEAGVLLRAESRGRHLQVWLQVFRDYLGSVREELQDEFQ